MDSRWKIITFILVVSLIIFGYFLEENKSNVTTNPRLSKQEELELEIEELKEENFELQETKEDLSGQLEELQRDYNNAEDLIDILRDQLETYGIEPYEL